MGQAGRARPEVRDDPGERARGEARLLTQIAGSMRWPWISTASRRRAARRAVDGISSRCAHRPRPRRSAGNGRRGVPRGGGRRNLSRRAIIEWRRRAAAPQEEEMTVLMLRPTPSMSAHRPIREICRPRSNGSPRSLLERSAEPRADGRKRAVCCEPSLKRTRGALEERELLIRRLERSASNNALVLGRLRTGHRASRYAPSVSPTRWALDDPAELVRIDGEQPISVAPGAPHPHRAGARLRAADRFPSRSSRNHALVLPGPPWGSSSEDLNSTNGVLVNGRSVSTTCWSSGDMLTVSEIQFRCVVGPRCPGEADQDPAGRQPRRARRRRRPPATIYLHGPASG